MKSIKFITTAIVLMLSATMTQAQSPTLGEALDNTNLVWSASDWFGQTNMTHDGADAAQSGVIGNNAASVLETTVSATGRLTFWWKVSSEKDNDKLVFSWDGAEYDSISYETDWAQVSVEILDAGSHTLTWSYEKDGDTANGSDCAWLDEVTWTPLPVVVTFDGNGGVPASGRRGQVFDALYSLPSDPVRAGYAFKGWFTAATGGGERTAASKVELDYNHTLYAQWTTNAYTVTFDSAGGTVDPDSVSKQVAFDSAYGTLPTPTLVGYTFSGWFDTETGGSPVTNTTIVATATNHTLYAQWVANTYDVTFNGNEGTPASAVVPQTYDSEYVLPSSAPARTGYTFEGWFDAKADGAQVTTNSTVATATNHTLYAQWTANTYTVDLDAGLGMVEVDSIEVDFDSPYGEIPEAMRPGYTFEGWLLSGVAVSNATIVATADNHTLTAEWAASELNVNFDAQGGSVDPLSKGVTFGERYRLLPTPTRNDYSFDGWFTTPAEGNRVRAITSVTNTTDHTLYAQWTFLPTDEAVNNTNLTWAASGDAPWFAQTATTYDGVSALQSGAIGHNQKSIVVATVEGPVTLSFWWKVSCQGANAIYTNETHDILAFYTNDVECAVISGEVDWEQVSVRLPAGNHKLAWSYEKDVYVQGGSDCGWLDQVELLPFGVGVTFDAQGGTPGSADIGQAYGDNYILPSDPVRDGYTFNGWFDSETDGAQVTTNTVVAIDEDQTLYAQWTANEYTVTFDAQGGTLAPATPIKVTFGSTYGTLPVPTLQDSVFDGWSTNMTGAVVDAATAVDIASDHTLYAQWHAVRTDEALSNGAVTWTDAGNAPWFGQTTTLRDGKATLQSGAILDNETSGVESTVTGPLSLSFWWKVSCETSVNTDFLAFYTNGVEATRINGEQDWTQFSVELPEGSHTLAWAYTKNGNGKTDGSDCGWLDSVTWPVTVTFDAQGGAVEPGTQEVYVGAAYGALPTPVLAGYMFAGWATATNGTPVTVETAVVSATNHTLYAQWKVIEESVTVTFNAQGGVVSSATQEAAVGSTYGQLPTPTFAGYTFAGWFTEATGGTVVTTATMVPATDHTLYAQWTANVYTVTFDAQGGTVDPATKQVTFNMGYGELPTPELTDWLFKGWYTGTNGTETLVTSSTLFAAAGDITLYAFWQDDYPYLSDTDVGTAPVLTTAYNGFVYDTNNTVCGTLTLNAKAGVSKGVTTWTVSAKVILKNASVSFSGKFPTVDQVTITTKKDERLSVTMQGNRFFGTLVGGKAGTTELTVDGARNAFAKATPVAAAVQGLYNVALLDSTSDAPRGYVTLNVNNIGTVKIAGKLEDGTSVSGSAKLLDYLNEDGWYCIAFYKPLYLKKGFIGGLLWLDTDTKAIRVDTDYGWFVDWDCQDAKKGGPFTRELYVLGGRFGDGKAAQNPPTGLRFSASVPTADLPAPVQGLENAGWVTDAYPWEMPVTVNGVKLSLLPATTPKKGVNNDYLYVGDNLSSAKLTYTAKTGLFKGSYKLYYDGLNGKGIIQHKTASVSYAGVLVPMDDGTRTGYGTGLTTINKVKVGMPVYLD